MLLRLPSVFSRLARSQRGGAFVEYTVLVALISVAMVAALNTIGQTVQGVLSAAAGAMT